MAKRGAESSLTKNNWQDEAEGDEEVEGEFAEASKDKLAARKFVKVKRKGEDGSAGETDSKFSLTNDTSSTNPGFNFDFSKPAEQAAKPSETPAPAVNAFQALMNPSNWECPVCEVSNKKDVLKCAACENPKPGSAPAAENTTTGTEDAKPAFTFGSTSTPFTFGTNSTTPFTFGTGTTGTGFSFGTTPNFTFSGSTDSPFTFGSSTAGPVTFGEVKGTTFGTGAPTSFETTEQLVTGGDQTKEEFKDKVAEPTGTEKDVTLFKLPTTVYILSKVESKGENGEEKKEAMKFVECGEGELKVNTVEDGGKKIARVVLRVEKTQRLALNAPLFSGMTLGLQGEKYVKFCSNDLEGKAAVYLLKFKNKTESTQVKEHMEKAIAFTTN